MAFNNISRKLPSPREPFLCQDDTSRPQVCLSKWGIRSEKASDRMIRSEKIAYGCCLAKQ